jgi:hypothetical protein
MKSGLSILDQLLDRNRGPRERLECVPGFSFDDDYRGKIEVAGTPIHFRIEPGYWLRLYATIASAEPGDALRQNLDLTGNIRWAKGASGTQIVADMQLSDVSAFPIRLQELAVAMECIAHPREPTIRISPSATEALASDKKSLGLMLSKLSTGNSALVERDEGWELRTRVAGVAVSVEVVAETTHVRVRAPVLACLPGGIRGQAVIEQALRSNAQLRFIRLSLTPAVSICVETCSCGPAADEHWLEFAIRQVTHGRHAAGEVLSILAEHEAIAGWSLALVAGRQVEASQVGLAPERRGVTW